MKTRPYSDLFDLVQALCGVVFASIETGRIKALINRRAKKAYRATNYWTRFLVIGEGRYMSADPVGATSLVPNVGYFIDSVGTTDFKLIGADENLIGKYFVATAAGNGTGTARPALNYVPYSEDGKRDIDTFLRIQKTQPWLSASVQDYDFTVYSNGATIICGNLNPAQAWVTYKADFPDTFGPSAGTDTTEIPDEWFEYLAHATYADYLRAEGQQERAALADQEADLILQDELMRLDEQHTQTLISNRIFTNSNMQLRY
jgi:hypothetical protein